MARRIKGAKKKCACTLRLFGCSNCSPSKLLAASIYCDTRERPFDARTHNFPAKSGPPAVSRYACQVTTTYTYKISVSWMCPPLPLPSCAQKNATAIFTAKLLLVLCPEKEKEASADCEHDGNKCLRYMSQVKTRQPLAVYVLLPVFCASFHETGDTGKRTCRKRHAGRSIT